MHVGATIEQESHGFGLSEEGGEVERRGPVSRLRGHEGRVLVEQFAQAGDIADGRGLEDVERSGACLSELVSDRDAVVVAEHQRRDAVLVARFRELGVLVEQPANPLCVLGLDRVEHVHLVS